MLRKILSSFLIVVVFFFFLPLRTVSAQSIATVSVSPASSNINVGQSVTLDINITDADDAGGFDLQIDYDQSVVTIPSTASVTLGAFLASTGRTVQWSGTPIIDNATGLLTAGAFSFGAQAGPNGNGNLMSVTFDAVGNGTSNIDLQNVALYRTDSSVQSSTPSNGTITVDPTTPTLTPSPTPTQPDPGGNIAPLAVVSASSEFSSGFAAVKAVDGVKQASFGEWASDGERDPWLQLDWSQSYAIDHIIFYDRINGTDHAAGGTLTFSDGSSVDVSGIPNSGAPHTVNFDSRTVDWVNFQVVGGSGLNVGLSEIEVF